MVAAKAYEGGKENNGICHCCDETYYVWFMG
jgi:hypothetical protein